MLFIVLSSAAFNLSVWILKKTYNGMAAIANMSVAAAVAAYSYSTNPNVPSNTNTVNDDDNSIELEMLDCVIVSNCE